jgi:hypothetical protein
MNQSDESENPLGNLDEWDEFVVERYPQPGKKAKEDYRNYDNPGRETVREFYRLNHCNQTYDFVQRKKQQYLALDHREMTVLEAMDYLNTLVDDSDPDIDLSQKEHLLQTSEAIRADGHDDWFVLTGFIHDLGKSSASSASRNGPWSETRSRWAAPSAAASSIPSSSRTIRTTSIPGSIPRSACIRPDAGSVT